MENLLVKCPRCGAPDQMAGLPCGFCRHVVPVPKVDINIDGETERLFAYKGLTWDGYGFKSPAFPYSWAPDIEWHTAECHRLWDADNPERHTPDADDPDYWPPVKGCNHPGHGCGFYCARTATHLIEVGYAGAITAKVELAGKIIPAVNGFRAQKMRLETFNVPYERWREVDAIKAAYPDVEVELASPMLPDKAALPEWCPKCGSRWSGRSATCGFCGYHHR